MYGQYNRREYVHPDPLEYLYGYPETRDREVVGLIASSLAYGRVAQILKSVSAVLDAVGPGPADFTLGSTEREIRKSLEGFKHRFTTGADVASMLCGAGRAIRKHGSLNACFNAGLSPSDTDVVPALRRFAAEITGLAGCPCDFLLPSIEKGSACKRLNLYLRWMVRRDEVDPGGWQGVSPAMLLIPLDTHMHRTGLALGFTTRRQAGLRTAMEITEGFRVIAPDDPVRYDFCLTRLGIRTGLSLDDFLARIDEEQG
ncbi:MAG: TIGR02757 family protein [Candidatus Geothermincolia bacterium]